MSSEKRIAANRQNAQRSTGPKTPAGRAKAGMNALKHGVLARRMLLPDEDPRELTELEAQVHESLAPDGAMECALAERIVVCLWRLRRVYELETLVLVRQMDDARRSQEGGAVFRALTKEPEPSPADLGLAVIRDGSGSNAITKLSRYEVSLERSMYRALHELQRMQAERGARATAPVAVDVDVDVLVREDLDRGDR